MVVVDDADDAAEEPFKSAEEEDEGKAAALVSLFPVFLQLIGASGSFRVSPVDVVVEAVSGTVTVDECAE